MGCRAITPTLVGLASEHEGKPFHLIASHVQPGERGDVVEFIKSQGLESDVTNLTVVKDGRHPRVKSAGSVPYYMVFDQHGDIAHHHMAGAYHGGDGTGQADVVAKLLKDTPAIYLGREPFPVLGKLARKVGQGKNVGATLKPLEASVETEPDVAKQAEIRRLISVVESWRNRQIRHAVRGLERRPSGVVAQLEALAKLLKGSALADEVMARLAELNGGDTIARGVVVEKAIAKIEKQLAKAKPCKACKKGGAKSSRAGCDACRAKNAKSIAKLRESLDALSQDNADLPIAARLTELRGALD